MYNIYNTIHTMVTHNKITWSHDNPVYGNKENSNIINITNPNNNISIVELFIKYYVYYNLHNYM